MKQADVVGLLTVGSKTLPKDDVLQIGDAGSKQLVEVRTQGEEKGLAGYFEKEKGAAAAVLGPSGLPPMPCDLSRQSSEGARKYVMNTERTEGYPERCER